MISSITLPEINELVIAKVIKHNTRVFTLVLLEYNNIEVQMLVNHVCSSKWIADIKRVCPLNRIVVCSVIDVSGLIPMVMMSNVDKHKSLAAITYWKQYRKALAYAKKAVKITKQPLDVMTTILVNTDRCDKRTIIDDLSMTDSCSDERTGHRIVGLKYLDKFSVAHHKATENLSDVRLLEGWNSILEHHHKIFNKHWYTNTVRAGIVLSVPDGVNILNTILTKIHNLSGDTTIINVWRDEPPFYDFKISALIFDDIKPVSLNIIQLLSDNVREHGELLIQSS